MAAILPKSRERKVRFFELHLQQWRDHAAELGLGAEQLDAIEALAASAREAYVQQQALRQAARSATQDFNARVGALLVKGGEAIAQIKAKAIGAGSAADAIYTAAQLPAPADRSRVPAPGTPSGLAVTLRPDGSLKLAWKCKNPAGSQGTIYEVRRREFGTGGEGRLVGMTGVKSFVDETIPAGTGSVVYEITAVRSTRRGTAGQFVVNLGVAAGGERGAKGGAEGGAAAVKVAA